MSNSSYDGPEMVIGGIVFVCFLVGILIKAIISIVKDIGNLCLAIGNTAESFLMMLLRIAEVALLAGLAIGSVTAAVYFTYKYIQMVKRGTEIMAECERRCAEMTETVEQAQKELEARVAKEVRVMRRELNAALEQPVAAPTVTQAVIEVVAEMKPVLQIESSNAIATTERVSNPY